MFSYNRVKMLSLVLASSLLLAFTSVENATSAWHGKSMTELLASWGPPAYVFESADGRKSLVYRHAHRQPDGAPFCMVSMAVDASGMIVAARVDPGNIPCGQIYLSE